MPPDLSTQSATAIVYCACAPTFDPTAFHSGSPLLRNEQNAAALGPPPLLGAVAGLDDALLGVAVALVAGALPLVLLPPGDAELLEDPQAATAVRTAPAAARVSRL